MDFPPWNFQFPFSVFVYCYYVFSGGEIAEKSFGAHECAKTTVNITLCGREFTTQKPTQNQDEKNSKENTERKEVLMQNEACFDMPWRHKFKLYRVFPFTSIHRIQRLWAWKLGSRELICYSLINWHKNAIATEMLELYFVVYAHCFPTSHMTNKLGSKF